MPGEHLEKRDEGGQDAIRHRRDESDETIPVVGEHHV